MPDLIRRATLKSMAGMATALTLAPCAVHATAGIAAPSVQPLAGGQLHVYRAFASRHVEPRTVSVWLPPGYDAAGQDSRRYAVLYMHDGRNVFDPATAMAGKTWGVAEHLADLVASGKVRPTIVVAIDHGAQRWHEYVPAAPLRALDESLRKIIDDNAPGQPRALLADAYLQFMVTELKPFIDQAYRSKPGRDDTVVMGASMGGLISLYALASYPQVFGGAGCLSTHWPMVNNGKLLFPQLDARVGQVTGAHHEWLRRHLPQAGVHRLYFDHGTINLDSLYGPFQKQADAVVAAQGYRRGIDWMTEIAEGADHNEPAWRARLAVPLQFLLRP